MKPPLSIPPHEYSVSAVRSSGPGGQHVNKVSTAVILRFAISASSLSETIKERLLASGDNRITGAGVLVLRCAATRSQLRNRETVIRRLHDIVEKAAVEKKQRKQTKPAKAAIEKRLEQKLQRSELKASRRKPIL
jgi:ribosome-associated protein